MIVEIMSSEDRAEKHLQELLNTKYDFSTHEFTCEKIFSAIPDTYCRHKKM